MSIEQCENQDQCNAWSAFDCPICDAALCKTHYGSHWCVEFVEFEFGE
jgi:hypothetical protein